MKVYIVTLVTDYAGQMTTDIDVLGTYATKEDAVVKANEKKEDVLGEMKEIGYEEGDYYVEVTDGGDAISIITDYDGGYLIDIWEQEVI